MICISADDQTAARATWEKIVERKFTVLSDPGSKVIRLYGVLDETEGIALDTTLFIGADGRERWRYVSATLPDLPKAEETLKHIRESLAGPAPGRKPAGRVPK